MPRGHLISANARSREPWWKWGNTTTDTYLFAINRPADVRVILKFDEQPNGTPEARFFVNDTGRKPLDFTIVGDHVNVRTNGGRPYVIVQPEQGGWLIDGKPNYNLRLLSYADAAGVNSGETVSSGGPTSITQVGAERPGLPGWETQRLTRDPNPNHGYPRFGADMRLADGPAFKVAPPLLPGFPYFGIGNKPIDWYTENPNPLYFDGNVQAFRFFPFVGFQMGGVTQINSLAYPPNVDFESPFATYSFDPTTRHAQLLVRAESYPAHDQFGPKPTDLQRSSFRYSWVTQDSSQWTYSLDVAGFHPFTQDVQIGNIHFRGVPPAKLPNWVTSKVWPVVTFVQALDGFAGSEGIYFYTAQGDGPWRWLGGLSAQPPAYLNAPYLTQDTRLNVYSGQAVPEHFRGEYADQDTHSPSLYLSPIDNRLHLLYAQGGVWNLGGSRILRVHNLNGGPYIDGWTVERVPTQTATTAPPRALPGRVEQALYAVDGYLLYSGAQSATIRRAAYQLSSFELPPPTNRQSWQDFVQRSAPYLKQARDPQKLADWLKAFPGESATIEGGQISDVRLTPNGFHFQLNLQPGFQLLGNPLLELGSLQPGTYLVTYDVHFTIVPVAPATFSLTVKVPRQAPDDHTAVPIEVAARNTGLVDTKGATLSVVAQRTGHHDTIARKVLDIRAGESPQQLFSWRPKASGPWEIQTELTTPGGAVVARNTQPLTVKSREVAPEQRILALSTGADHSVPAIGCLIAFAVLGGTIVRVALDISTRAP